MHWYYCGFSFNTRVQRQPQLNQHNTYNNAIQRYRSGTIHRHFYFPHDTGHDVTHMVTPLSSIRMVNIYILCMSGVSSLITTWIHLGRSVGRSMACPVGNQIPHRTSHSINNPMYCFILRSMTLLDIVMDTLVT